MGRRKFGKNAENVRHFRLVARSQNDACIDDADAAPLVLEPFVPPGEARRTGLTEAELLELPPSLQKLGPDVFGQGERIDHDQAPLHEGSGEDDEQESDDPDGLGALDGDCYFPKDGYNYDQHLKRVSGAGKPGGVVGVVLDAPVRPDCKPKEAKEFAIQEVTNQEQRELMRALEHADEYEEFDGDELDELFPQGVAEDLDVVVWGPTVHEQREMPDFTALKAAHKAMLEAAAAGRQEGRLEEESLVGGDAYVDEEGNEVDFDEFLDNEYADDEIGACEDEDIQGHLTMEQAEEAAEEYIEDQKAENNYLHSMNEPIAGKYDNVPRVTEETKAIISRHYENQPESDDDATVSGDDETDESRLWDCETVLSTLSNVSNRPGKIGKIKVLGKPKQLPKLEEEDEAEDDDDEESEAESVIELPDVITERKKDETAEEKRLRKASVKEMRRVCRRMKKESKEMYKNEAAKLPGNKATSDVKAKIRYQRL